MSVPNAEDLIHDPLVSDALEQAWLDSQTADPQLRHEEGGWVYLHVPTGVLHVARAPAGGQAALDLANPPLRSDMVVIATFHTHPNPASEGWATGPSASDTRSAWLLGVPCFIRAEDGVHVTGPSARRGGLSGGPGYPP